MSDRFGKRFQVTRNRFKFLTYVENKTSQLDIVVKSLPRFDKQFKENECFKFLFAMKVKNARRILAGSTVKYDLINGPIITAQ